jgi:CheY-like chemotaxis protein
MAIRRPAGARHAQSYLVDSCNLTGVRVLFVDDNEDSRIIVQYLLDYCGACTATAASASEAMRQVRALKPDVLITDFAMPGGDGYELLRRVRSLPLEDGGGVPAALLTAGPLEDHRTRACVAGFSGVMRKPVDPDAFCSLIAALAEPPAQRRPA